MHVSVITGRLAIPILLMWLLATPQGLANFLVDPGFENPSLVVPLSTIVNPLQSGFWGVENAFSVPGPAQGGIMPNSGNRMLEMWDDGLVLTQALQFVHFPSGAPSSLVASALFNSVSPNPAKAFVQILGYDNANDWGNHSYSSPAQYITLDTLSGTWEANTLIATGIPSTVTWIGFHVGFLNSSLQGYDGVNYAGYVDDTRLIPEPTSALPLVLGSAWLLAFRRR